MGVDISTLSDKESVNPDLNIHARMNAPNKFTLIKSKLDVWHDIIS